jgi:hypothetical protein
MILGFLTSTSLISFGLIFHNIQKNTLCRGLIDVSYLPYATVNEEWQLNVTIDYYPDSSWRLEDPKIKLKENNLSVFITICARKHRGVALPATFHLEASISLIFPVIGNWTIICNDITIYVQVY